MITVVPAARAGGNYGCRRQAGARDPACPAGSRRHHGVDIAAPEGSPIFAPLTGVVFRVWANGDLSRYGNLLVQYVPELNKTLVYAHLMAPPARADGTPLRQGDVITAGEQVALVGYTGACGRGARVSAHGIRCTPCGPGGGFLCSGPGGSHLHLEVRPGRIARPNPRGASINPTSFAREHGFNLFAGGPAGLGQLPATSDPDAYSPDKYRWYADPLGFEPGDDEPAPLSAPVKIVIGVAAGGVLAFVLAKVLS